MISVFYGKNDFGIDMEINKIRLSVAPEEVRDVNSVDPVSLIAHENVMVTVDAVKKLEEMLS